MEQLTSPDFWDDYYRHMSDQPLDWRNYVEIQLVRRLSTIVQEGQSVLEIGGGGARISRALARAHPTSRFVILDYSEVGCQAARKRVEREQLQNLGVVYGDMFKPSADFVGLFDIVFSIGLVEHFTDVTRSGFKTRLSSVKMEV